MESKLDKAQGRCEVLEKQLEHMRNIMLQNQSTSRSSPPTVFSTPPSLRRSFSIPPPISASPPKPSGSAYYSTVQGISPPKTSINTCCSSLKGESPAIAKLNDLEREHLKLTASQSMTEVCETDLLFNPMRLGKIIFQKLNKNFKKFAVQ